MSVHILYMYFFTLDWQSLSQSHLNLSDAIEFDVIRRPRFSNLLKDYSVPAGGTIALQVEVKGKQMRDYHMSKF